MNFIEKIIKNSIDGPHNKAINDSDEYISYADLVKRSLLYSKVFKKIAGSGTPCIVLSRNKITYFYAMLSAFFSKFIYVPISLRAPLQRNIDILRQIDEGAVILVGSIDFPVLKNLLSALESPKVIFEYRQNEKMFLELSLSYNVTYIDSYQYDNFAHDLKKFNYSFEPERIAYLMFTSGTTGQPKGVPISYRNLNAYLFSMLKAINIEPYLRIGQICDLSFDLSLHEFLVSLMSIGELYLYNDKQGSFLAFFLYKNKINYILIVPSVGVYLINQVDRLSLVLDHLKYVFFCGESLSLKLAEQFSQLHPKIKIINLYGPTEATIACSFHIYNKKHNYQNYKTVPIGKPLSSTQFKKDQNNELLISGDQVFAGYWNTIKLCDQPVYFSGDCVDFDPSFGFYYISRLDDQFQVKGQRIERAEVEMILRSVTHNHHIYICPKYNENLIVQLIILTVDEIQLDQFISQLRRKLPEALFPLRTVKIDEIPKLPNQKVDYKKLELYVNKREVVG